MDYNGYVFKKIAAGVIVGLLLTAGIVRAANIGSGDVDGNGVVNEADLILLLRHWFAIPNGSQDQYIDGQINAFDAAVVMLNLQTAGLPFGPFNYENTPDGNVFTGGQTWLSANNAVTTLDLARSRHAHVQVHLNGNHQDFVNSDGSFSLSLWKSQLDTFLINLGNGNKATGIATIQNYVDDGTIIGHFMIDEPQDSCGNWGCNPFNTADIEAAAAYSKAYWPNLATGIGSHPNFLITCTNNCYPDLDYTSSPYTCKQGDITAWEDTHVTQATQLGIRIAMSLNVVVGGCGGTQTQPVAMTADQVLTWGQQLIAEPYNSMLTLYQYDPTYFGQTDVDAAITQLALQAKARTNVHPLLKN